MLRLAHNLLRLSRNALATTDTEFSAIAAPAKISLLVALVYYVIFRWPVHGKAAAPRDNIEA